MRGRRKAGRERCEGKRGREKKGAEDDVRKKSEETVKGRRRRRKKAWFWGMRYEKRGRRGREERKG